MSILEIVLLIGLSISGIIFTTIRYKLGDTILKYDDSYTGLGFNTYDVWRIYKIYKNESSLTVNEKKMLKIVLISFIISMTDSLVLFFCFYMY
jgi:hypothetical protein